MIEKGKKKTLTAPARAKVLETPQVPTEYY
jgi:hypothetical protein